jgi:hypothetical protein
MNSPKLPQINTNGKIVENIAFLNLYIGLKNENNNTGIMKHIISILKNKATICLKKIFSGEIFDRVAIRIKKIIIVINKRNNFFLLFTKKSFIQIFILASIFTR